MGNGDGGVVGRIECFVECGVVGGVECGFGGLVVVEELGVGG